MFITAAIEFKLKKQPCTKIEITTESRETTYGEGQTFHYNKHFIEIELSESKTVTNIKEIKSFMSDTAKLIKSFAYQLPLNILKNNDLVDFLNKYLRTWGMPQPINGTKIELAEFIYTCTKAYCYVEFWPYMDANGKDILADGKIVTSLLQEVEKHQRTIKSKELYLLPCISIKENEISISQIYPSKYNPSWNCKPKEWLAEKEKAHNSAIPIFAIKTDAKELELIIKKDIEEQIEWIRKKIKESLSYFISKQLPVLQPLVTKAENFIYQAEFHNRILFFLVKKIEMCESETVKKCACGCDKFIPVNKTYYSKVCEDKVRNNKPGKGLKSIVRSRFYRGDITKETKEYFYKKIDTMLNEKYNEEEIRKVILSEIKAGE